MYFQAESFRSAGRHMDLPVAVDPVATARLILGRVRKLLGAYLPGMSFDRRRWREALATPLKAPSLERERLFVLGWLRWLEGDWQAAESLFGEVHARCQSAPAEENPTDDLPPLEPGLLLARSAYWCARVRILAGRADAVSGYESAMRRLGGSPQATAWYVDLLWRAGRIDRAEQVWKSVRTNKRVLACDEGPLLDARGHLRKGELGPAEKLLREATTTNGVVWVERHLLLAWALAGLRQADRAAEPMRLACEGPYPLPALTAWRNMLQGRVRNQPVSVETTVPGWRELVEAQRLRGLGQRDEAAALYRTALGHVAVQPFARYGLACLGLEDPAEVLASGPGLFFAVRCRAKQSIARFRRREIGPGELLEALQQASSAGYHDGAAEHFRRLALVLQNKLTFEELASLLALEGPARRNAARVILEQTVRLGLKEVEPLFPSLVEALIADDSLGPTVGRQMLRWALVRGDSLLLEMSSQILPDEPLLGVARILVSGETGSEEETHPAALLWRAANRLAVRDSGSDWLEKVKALPSQPRYRGIAQALLLHEAAVRGDVGAAANLLEEVDAWRFFRPGPPDFVRAALAALAGGQPGHAAWRRCLPRWLALWSPEALAPEGKILANIAGTAEGAKEAPAGVEPAAWFLHQSARALQREDAGEALSLLERALELRTPESPDGALATRVVLQRRADAQAIARCFPDSGTSAALLVDLVDLLASLPEGTVVLQHARQGKSPEVQSDLAALVEKSDLPGGLYHHLALLWWRSAQKGSEGDSARAGRWRLAWRCWLAFLRSPESPGEYRAGLLLDHLLAEHRRRINDLVARDDMESARQHWDLVGSLPSFDERMKDVVARFRDDLATEYLLTTREAMRHGTIPEGWRADYDRALSLLGRLLSLDRDNVRLLTALVEVCGEWFFDLYNAQSMPTLVEQVNRYTSFALHLGRLIEDRPGELAARAVLSDFCKFRGFIEPNRSEKIALYREALRLNPANGNVRELLAGIGVSAGDSDASSPRGSDDE